MNEHVSLAPGLRFNMRMILMTSRNFLKFSCPSMSAQLVFCAIMRAMAEVLGLQGKCYEQEGPSREATY